MPDLVYDKTLAGQNREKAQLELNFLATTTSTTYEVVPGLAMLDGYRPATTTARTPLFLGSTGTNARDQVSQRHALGVQTFQTTAPLNNTTVAKMLAKAQPSDTMGGQVLARYTDANLTVWQGQAMLVYTGEVGNGVAENTMYGWTLEWIASQATSPAYVP
jgi:hypothetical protein